MKRIKEKLQDYRIEVDNSNLIFLDELFLKLGRKDIIELFNFIEKINIEGIELPKGEEKC